MPSCVVKNCTNNSVTQKKATGITFHKFPAVDVGWRQKWIEAIRLNRNDDAWVPSQFTVVCSVHFDDFEFYLTKTGLRRITKDAFPHRMMEPGDILACNDGEVIQPTVFCHSPKTRMEICEYFGVDEPNDHDEEEAEAMSSDGDNSSTKIEDSSLNCLDIDSTLHTPLQSHLLRLLKRKTNLLNNNKRELKMLQQKVRRLQNRNISIKRSIKSIKDQINVDGHIGENYNMLSENVEAVYDEEDS